MEEIQNEPLLGSKDIESQKEAKPKRRYYWIAALCVGIGLIVGTIIRYVSFHSNTSITSTTTSAATQTFVNNYTISTLSNSTTNQLSTDEFGTSSNSTTNQLSTNVFGTSSNLTTNQLS